MILTEFDECELGTFNPTDIQTKIESFPKIAISWFSQKLMDSFIAQFRPVEIAKLSNANGKTPIYKIQYKETEIAVFLSRVGAPACAVSYEELIAMGVEKLILFGTCGVLDKKIEDLAIIIPTSAIRDEGTSYHYREASDEIEVNQKYIDLFEELLHQHNYPYIKGKTWTTDAPYRETRNKVAKRKEQGCICVEMECSAMNAVARFREKDLFQFFYAADNLDSAVWDSRSLGNQDRLTEKEKLIYLALELAIKIKEKETK